LLRHGHQRPAGVNAWTAKHHVWLSSLKFEIGALEATFTDYLHEVEHANARIIRLEAAIDEAVEKAPAELRAVIAGLQALRGVAKTAAVGIAVEVGKFSRFDNPRKLMGYSGAVPSEHSSGEDPKRGGITKTGNSHLRRLLTESAWSYRHSARMYSALRKRQKDLDPEINAIAWRGQVRLSTRFRRLSARGKPSQKVVTAVARELLGFIWEIAVHIEQQAEQPPDALAA